MHFRCTPPTWRSKQDSLNISLFDGESAGAVSNQKPLIGHLCQHPPLPLPLSLMYWQLHHHGLHHFILKKVLMQGVCSQPQQTHGFNPHIAPTEWRVSVQVDLPITISPVSGRRAESHSPLICWSSFHGDHLSHPQPANLHLKRLVKQAPGTWQDLAGYLVWSWGSFHPVTVTKRTGQWHFLKQQPSAASATQTRQFKIKMAVCVWVPS